jgi:hypothetical protein
VSELAEFARWLAAARKVVGPIRCETCGREVLATTAGRFKKHFCSRLCARRAYRQRHRDHLNAYLRACRAQRRPRPAERPCAVYSRPFSSPRPQARYCSARCKHRAHYQRLKRAQANAADQPAPAQPQPAQANLAECGPANVGPNPRSPTFSNPSSPPAAAMSRCRECGQPFSLDRTLAFYGYTPPNPETLCNDCALALFRREFGPRPR